MFALAWSTRGLGMTRVLERPSRGSCPESEEAAVKGPVPGTPPSPGRGRWTSLLTPRRVPAGRAAAAVLCSWALGGLGVRLASRGVLTEAGAGTGGAWLGFWAGHQKSVSPARAKMEPRMGSRPLPGASETLAGAR